jgi:hypothetical protein
MAAVLCGGINNPMVAVLVHGMVGHLGRYVTLQLLHHMRKKPDLKDNAMITRRSNQKL